MYYDEVVYKSYIYYVTYNIQDNDVKISRDLDDFDRGRYRKATADELYKELGFDVSHSLTVSVGIIEELLSLEYAW